MKTMNLTISLKSLITIRQPDLKRVKKIRCAVITAACVSAFLPTSTQATKPLATRDCLYTGTEIRELAKLMTPNNQPAEVLAFRTPHPAPKGEWIESRPWLKYSQYKPVRVAASFRSGNNLPGFVIFEGTVGFEDNFLLGLGMQVKSHQDLYSSDRFSEYFFYEHVNLRDDIVVISVNSNHDLVQRYSLPKPVARIRISPVFTCQLYRISPLVPERLFVLAQNDEKRRAVPSAAQDYKIFEALARDIRKCTEIAGAYFLGVRDLKAYLRIISRYSDDTKRGYLTPFLRLLYKHNDLDGSSRADLEKKLMRLKRNEFSTSRGYRHRLACYAK